MHISEETLALFSANSIDIVTYPLNCTDELQRLDEVPFRPLQAR